MYIPYRILIVGPLHFASLCDCESSLLRTTGPLDSPRRLPLRHARSPTLWAPPLRSSSGGFEQLRPSSGRLRSEPLGSTLFAFVVHFAARPLPRSEPNAFDDGLRLRAKVPSAFDDGLRYRAKVASPTVRVRSRGRWLREWHYRHIVLPSVLRYVWSARLVNFPLQTLKDLM